MPDLPPVQSGPTDYVENLPPGFSAQQAKTDLEAAVVERFGSAALKRASMAEAYVLSRHYRGLPQPPNPKGPRRFPLRPYSSSNRVFGIARRMEGLSFL
jgi:hypothetical protein